MEVVLGRNLRLYITLALLALGCRNEPEHVTTQVEKADNTTKTVPSQQPFPSQLRDGDSLERDDSGNLLAHSLVRNGREIYKATYIDNRKVSNTLYPLIQDAFLFEDKYYLKVYFPYPYRGTMNIELSDDPEYVLTPLENQKYQVVINHALDLHRVDFTFRYIPAEVDTLVETRFSFTYVIMEK
nr:hypothetical protein [Cytophagales bacterium]